MKEQSSHLKMCLTHFTRCLSSIRLSGSIFNISSESYFIKHSHNNPCNLKQLKRKSICRFDLIFCAKNEKKHEKRKNKIKQRKKQDEREQMDPQFVRCLSHKSYIYRTAFFTVFISVSEGSWYLAV